MNNLTSGVWRSGDWMEFCNVILLFGGRTLFVLEELRSTTQVTATRACHNLELWWSSTISTLCDPFSHGVLFPTGTQPGKSIQHIQHNPYKQKQGLELFICRAILLLFVVIQAITTKRFFVQFRFNVSMEGLEPTTIRLKARCSTNWATYPVFIFNHCFKRSLY